MESRQSGILSLALGKVKEEPRQREREGKERKKRKCSEGTQERKEGRNMEILFSNLYCKLLQITNVEVHISYWNIQRYKSVKGPELPSNSLNLTKSFCVYPSDLKSLV